MTTRLIFALTSQQKSARLTGEESIRLTPHQTAALRRSGLLARSHEWYSSPCGSFALAPGDPAAPWGTGERTRVNLNEAAASMREAA